MDQVQKYSLLALRLTLGWMFFYAGITKVLDPAWSAAGYISSAKTFAGFYNLLLQPNILPLINFVNEWGLTLLGISLILGICVRLSSSLGVVLMMLYYLAALDFPYPNTHAFIVDEHIIYSAALIYLAVISAGRSFGVDRYLADLKIWEKFPRFKNWLI